MTRARHFAIAIAICVCICASADEQDTHNPLEKILMRNALVRVGKEHIRLSVNMTSVQQDGQMIEVRWSGVHNPSFDDWVGVLAPANAEVPQRAPVKYKLASSDFFHILKGEGKVSFSLENHRTDMRIAFFRNGFENPHMVAETSVIRVHDINRPSHGRISLTADPSEMLVQWTTGDSKGGWVKWGEQTGNYTWKAEAKDLTYIKSDMCGGAAAAEGWLEPGVFHYALITGLQAATRYYYIFGDASTGWSGEFSFQSAPVTGPDTNVKILCLADLGQAETDGSNEQSEMLPSLNTTALMLADARAEDYQLIVHHGDISYARGYVTQWDRCAAFQDCGPALQEAAV